MITVDRQVIEGAGTCTSRRPSAGSFVGRSTPRRTPDGHPLAERLAARIKDARAEQEAGERGIHGLVRTHAGAVSGPCPAGACRLDGALSPQAG